MKPNNLTEESDKNNNEIEMKNLVNTVNDLEKGFHAMPVRSGVKKPDGFFQQHMQELGTRFNVKMLMRKWGPALEFVVRLMLVATFFDDSLHTAISYPEHAKQISEQGLKWLFNKYPDLTNSIAIIALGVGILAQFIGSICLLILQHPDHTTKALIGWVIAQPILYGQVFNIEFVAESVSLIGGLIMLRVHLVDNHTLGGSSARMHFLGRLLLPTMYLYYAGHCLFMAFTFDETSSFATYISSLSMFVINTVMLAALVISSTLVAAGLKSRIIALLLALLNLIFAFYNHPFFSYIWYEDGQWKYEDSMPIPNVRLPKDITPNALDADQIYELHRYYFFLGLSTSGALLLLVQLGPGNIAVQKNEMILPTMAQD